MPDKNCRPADRVSVYRPQELVEVATPAMQDALWALAASAPERFVEGCTEASLCYLSEWPGWFAFRYSPEHRQAAERIIALAARVGIAEQPAIIYTSSAGR